jgi:uncharacterized membrane protein YadS
MYILAAVFPIITFTLSFFVKEKEIEGKVKKDVFKILSPNFIVTFLLIFCMILYNFIKPDTLAGAFGFIRQFIEPETA